MPFSTRDVQERLVNKFGFVKARTHETGHDWYLLEHDGLPPIRTKLSHGRPEISGDLEKRMSKQLRVRTGFFRQMIECTKSCAEYLSQSESDPYPSFDQIIV